jgi:hypothetical protein
MRDELEQELLDFAIARRRKDLERTAYRRSIAYWNDKGGPEGRVSWEIWGKLHIEDAAELMLKLADMVVDTCAACCEDAGRDFDDGETQSALERCGHEVSDEHEKASAALVAGMDKLAWRGPEPAALEEGLDRGKDAALEKARDAAKEHSLRSHLRKRGRGGR